MFNKDGQFKKNRILFKFISFTMKNPDSFLLSSIGVENNFPNCSLW